MTTDKALLLAAALLLPSMGCQTLDPTIAVAVPTAETAQDKALSESVRQRLLADKDVDLTAVKVVSKDGTVYLTGAVNSLDARQQAIKNAWEVRGVQSVVNSLEIRN